MNHARASGFDRQGVTTTDDLENELNSRHHLLLLVGAVLAFVVFALEGIGAVSAAEPRHEPPTQSGPSI